MRLIKRWWSEQLGRYIYLRAGEPRAYHLTVADRGGKPSDYEFHTEADARAYAEQLMAEAPEGGWRQQPR